MAKLPIRQQQTRPQGARASGADFGSQVGQTTAGTGSELFEIGDRIKRRDEVIDRVRLQGQFNQLASQELEAWSTTEDVTNPDSVKVLNEKLRENMEQTIGQHRGRLGSKAEFRTQLENQYNQFSQSAINSQIKAQHDMLANYTEQAGNTFGITASEAPDQLDNLLNQATGDLAKIAPALTDQEETAHSNSLRQKIINGGINGLLKQGQWETAKTILNDPNYNKYLSPDSAQKASIQIGKAQAQAVAEQKRIERNITSYSIALGRNLSPEETAKIKMMPDQDDMTLSDKIVQLELLTGQQITQDQIDKLAGTYIAPSGSGSSGTMKERFFNTLSTNVTPFAAGALSEQQDREFLTVVNELYGPKEMTDPITGLRRVVQPSMPNYIREALEMRGFNTPQPPE